MSGRVLIVGSVNVDLVVQTERLPLPGETVMGGTFSRFHGGKGGNQAVAAARLGVPVMLVAALGDDEFGTEARAALAREGVGTDVLVTLDHTATGVALILVDAKAENQIAVAPGANAGLTATHVRQALGRLNPHAGDAVIVTHEIPTDAAREALRIGRAGGAWTILNPAPADGLDRSVISLADVVVPNRGELARLVADDARRAGRTEPASEEPVKAARSLLEANAEGPGAGEAILVSLERPVPSSSGATGAPWTSRRPRSRPSTRRVPGTRSTEPSRRRWPAGWTSRRRPDARSWRRASP